jgi:hypothetical protein
MLVDIDIKPGSCPNSYNPNSRGVLPVAVVGTDGFDVSQIDLASVTISRADGVGGSIEPQEGPPGSHSVIEDVATPFSGEACGCHELEGDGIDDLSLKFKTVDLVAALELDLLPGGDMPELVVSGTLVDGGQFEGSECVRLVPPTSASLTKVQQSCVKAMDRSGAKVSKAQIKENWRCLKDFQKGKLLTSMTFDDCTTADRKGKVQEAKNKTEKWEDSKCDSLDVPPPFAYTSSATVNTAAVDGTLALTDEIFGAPPALVTRAADKETARCQLEMLMQAGRLEYTILKQLYRANRRSLKDETINSNAALEAKLQAALSSNAKIDRAENTLVSGVNKKCADLAPPDTIFPGYDCGAVDPDLGDVGACAIAAARCEACLKINAFDGLDLDCDQADDKNNTNESCP